MAKKTSSNKKGKNQKGQDFHEFAQKNGINYNIKYEEKNTQAKKTFKPSDQNETPSHSGGSNPNSYGKPNTYQEQPNNNNYKKKNNQYKKKNYYNNNEMIPNSNKFDHANYQMMMMHPQQFFGMMNPQMMMPQQQPFQQETTTENFSKITLEEAGDDTIMKQLEYYFSPENLNQDHFIREKLNDQGFLNAKEIINFKKMKAYSVSIEKIQNILEKFNTEIEPQVLGGELFLRNKNWDTIKEKMTPLNEITKKKQTTIQNTNYVHMQNNFYYNVSPQMMMMPQGQQPYMMPGMMMGYPMNPVFQGKSNNYSDI